MASDVSVVETESLPVHVVRIVVRFSILAAISGCGVAVPIFPPSHSPPDVRFEGWLLTPSGDYPGRLQNGGGGARDVRVEVWYAAGLTESVWVVVPPTGEIRELGTSYFYASPQMTNGESRYPRLGMRTSGVCRGNPRAFAFRRASCSSNGRTTAAFATASSGHPSIRSTRTARS